MRNFKEYKWLKRSEDLAVEDEVALMWTNIGICHTTYYGISDQIAVHATLDEFLEGKFQKEIASIHGSDVLNEILQLARKIKNPVWDFSNEAGRAHLTIGTDRFIRGEYTLEGQHNEIEMRTYDFVVAEDLLHEIKRLAPESEFDELLRLANISWLGYRY